MKSNLTMRYEKIGDILYLDQCQTYPEQESEKLGDEIIAYLNPTNGNIENLEVLFLAKRLQTQTIFEVPISAQLHNSA